jgi:prevent-host-death family protein
MELVGGCAVLEVNIHEAKTHLSRLLNRVLAGEEIVIAKAGVPIARIVPIKHKLKKRVPGNCSGKIWIAEDFDGPLPEDIIQSFEGSL